MTNRAISRALPALFAALCLASPAGAQGSREVELAQQRDRAVLETLIAADTVSDARVVWLSRYLAANMDGQPGLTEADEAIRRSVSDAWLRSMYVVRQLRYDIDGDLVVTAEEALPFAFAQAMDPIGGGARQVAPNADQIAQLTEAWVAKIMTPDIDGDGAMSLRELMELPPQYYRDPTYEALGLPFLMLLDTDGDGVVSEAEFLAPLELAAARMDVNGDGILSRIEKQQRSDRKVPETAAQKEDRALVDMLLPKRSCDLSPITPDAQLLIIGGYDGAAISNIEIGQEGAPAYVVDLVIAEDPRPLSVVLTFQEPVILRLSGATERLTQVRTLKHRFGVVNRAAVPLSGGSVQGQRKLTLWRASPASEQLETIRTWTGRDDVLIASGYTIGTVTLGPSDVTVSPSVPGGHVPDFSPAAMEIWSEMLRFNPSGLILLDPEDIHTIGSKKLLPEVWPQEAGLAQLVNAGLLTPLADRSVQDMRTADDYGVVTVGAKKYRWDGGDDLLMANGLNYVQERPGQWIGRAAPQFRINAPIRLPAGLYGAHMAEFLLPAGIPEPTGDRGDSASARMI